MAKTKKTKTTERHIKLYIVRHIEDPADEVMAVIQQTKKAKQDWLAKRRAELGGSEGDQWWINSNLKMYVFIKASYTIPEDK